MRVRVSEYFRTEGLETTLKTWEDDWESPPGQGVRESVLLVLKHMCYLRPTVCFEHRETVIGGW